MTKRGSIRGSGANERRDRLVQEHEHDPYRNRASLPEPTVCSDCGAALRGGRWVRVNAPADANRTVCPACQRVRDDYPAGTLTLSGEFVAAHATEVLGLARNVERRESGEHPLKRIMAIREDRESIVITTTDAGLARNIGDALNRAYDGELDYRYADDETLVRVRWKR